MRARTVVANGIKMFNEAVEAAFKESEQKAVPPQLQNLLTSTYHTCMPTEPSYLVSEVVINSATNLLVTSVYNALVSAGIAKIEGQDIRSLKDLADFYNKKLDAATEKENRATQTANEIAASDAAFRQQREAKKQAKELQEDILTFAPKIDKYRAALTSFAESLLKDGLYYDADGRLKAVWDSYPAKRELGKIPEKKAVEDLYDQIDKQRQKIKKQLQALSAEERTEFERLSKILQTCSVAYDDYFFETDRSLQDFLSQLKTIPFAVPQTGGPADTKATGAAPAASVRDSAADSKAEASVLAPPTPKEEKNSENTNKALTFSEYRSLIKATFKELLGIELKKIGEAMNYVVFADSKSELDNPWKLIREVLKPKPPTVEMHYKKENDWLYVDKNVLDRFFQAKKEQAIDAAAAKRILSRKPDLITYLSKFFQSNAIAMPEPTELEDYVRLEVSYRKPGRDSEERNEFNSISQFLNGYFRLLSAIGKQGELKAETCIGVAQERECRLTITYEFIEALRENEALLAAARKSQELAPPGVVSALTARASGSAEPSTSSREPLPSPKKGSPGN